MLKISRLSTIFMGFSMLLFSACDDDPEKTGAVCGNGVLENGELCDLDQFGDTTCVSLGFDAGDLTCSAACEPVTTACVDWVCGDSFVDPNEACDGTWGDISCRAAGFVFGTATCAADCTLDDSGCSVPHGCGDGVIGVGEDCDGEVLPEATDCATAGLLAGTVTCDANCRLDYSGCGHPESLCGNGVVDPGEFCDGEDLDGQTCADRFYFGGGTLACREDCTFDDAGCVAVDEGTTSGFPCQLGLPCKPSIGGSGGAIPHVCASPWDDNPEHPFNVCLPACEGHADCPLGLDCLEADGISYCGEPPCDSPLAACTLGSGLPGICTPSGSGHNLCMVAGVRGYGQSCVVTDTYQNPFIPFFNFQYDALDLCASGRCNGDQYGDVGVCVEELCDAAGVLAGTAQDTCPPATNCVNTSRVEFDYLAPYRSPDRGACVPMFDYQEEGVSGRLACHVLEGTLTRYDLPCPDGTACVPMTDDSVEYPGSLYGTCAAVSATPLALGTECTEHSACGAGASCVMAEPFATPFSLENPQPYAKACRRPCDAAVFADNPACADLPEGTDWVCLSVTRFFTEDHELVVSNPNAPGGVEELDPSPLGFCVPNRI